MTIFIPTQCSPWFPSFSPSSSFFAEASSLGNCFQNSSPYHKEPTSTHRNKLSRQPSQGQDTSFVVVVVLWSFGLSAVRGRYLKMQMTLDGPGVGLGWVWMFWAGVESHEDLGTMKGFGRRSFVSHVGASWKLKLSRKCYGRAHTSWSTPPVTVNVIRELLREWVSWQISLSLTPPYRHLPAFPL